MTTVKPGETIERGGPVSGEWIGWFRPEETKALWWIECDEDEKWRDLENQWLRSLPSSVIINDVNEDGPMSIGDYLAK